MIKKFIFTIFLLSAVITGCQKEQTAKPAAATTTEKSKRITIMPVKGPSIKQFAPDYPINTIAFASNGAVYGVRRASNKSSVFKYANGVFTTLFSATIAPYNGNYFDRNYVSLRVVIDSKNNIYFGISGEKLQPGDAVYQGYGRIMKITPSGAISTFAELKIGLQYSDIADLSIDDNDNIFACDNNNNRIWKITPDAQLTTHMRLEVKPMSMAFDKLGNVYLAGVFSKLLDEYFAVYKFAPNGVKTLVVNDIATYIPLVVDKYNNVWFGGQTVGNWYIHVISSKGVSLASEYVDKNGLSLTFDKQGKLYYVSKSEIFECVFK